MNILIDCYHPANYLILRETSRILKEQGHNVVIAGRKKDVLVNLLTEDNANYFIPTFEGKQGGIGEFSKRLIEIRRYIKEKNIDRAIGASATVSLASLHLHTKSIVFNDDDPRVIPQFAFLAYPFATKVLTPDSVPKFPTRNLIRYNSNHAIAYLHPEIFKPHDVKSMLGINPNEKYVLVRCVKLSAFHDHRAIGLSKESLRHLIEELKPYARVFLSMEEPDLEFAEYFIDAPKNMMHSIIAHSILLISDSQTMTSEASILGVPSIRINTFVGRISYLKEIELAGLSFGFRPDEIDLAMKKMKQLLEDCDQFEFKELNQIYLKNKINPTQFFVQNILENKS